MGQPILDLISDGFKTKFSIMRSKIVGKFCFKQFGCNKQLDLLTVDVLNGFYCTFKHLMQFGTLLVQLHFQEQRLYCLLSSHLHSWRK